MIINVSTRFWIFLTVFTGCLSLVIFAGIAGFLFQEDIQDFYEEELEDSVNEALNIETNDNSGANNQPTLSPTQGFTTGPTINLTSIPAEAEQGRVVPLRIEANDTLTGMRSIEIYIDGRLVQAPQLLEGQQTAQVNFGYIPTELNDLTILVVAIATDGRRSEEIRLIAVTPPQETPNERVGFDLLINENDDPFELALGFGVCPTELLRVNPQLSALQPGANIFIPTDSGDLTPTTYLACERANQDLEVVNFFQNERLGIRRASLDVPFPIDLRFTITAGRAFECSSFPTGATAGAFGCPPEKAFFHTGIDIGADKGTELYSITNGEVTWAGPYLEWIGRPEDPCLYNGSEPPHEGYGNMVTVESSINGRRYEFLYAHLSEFRVSQGDIIEGEGFVIGLVGSTGCSTAPHLHFEVREGSNRIPVDPVTFLRDNEDVLAER